MVAQAIRIVGLFAVVQVQHPALPSRPSYPNVAQMGMGIWPSSMESKAKQAITIQQPGLKQLTELRSANAVKMANDVAPASSSIPPKKGHRAHAVQLLQYPLSNLSTCR